MFYPFVLFFVFKQKTAYEMRISACSSDVCSSDLIAAPAHPVALPSPARGALAFEHVTFHYPTRPEIAALHDFSLAIAPGETVAVVGPSGAGRRERCLAKTRPSVRWSLPPRSPASIRALSRSEEHTSELQSLMRISYAVFCLKKKNRKHTTRLTT